MSTHTPLRLPDTMRREDVGPYLAEVRTHFGLREQDVADRLHIRVRYLQAIEKNTYDQLPGPVYARGYLFTYAEFLGLDADQVVELCFGAEPAPAFTPPPLAARAREHRFEAAQWRNGAILALICAVILLVAAQLRTHRLPSTKPSVPPVPEELLTTQHTLIMPNAQNIDCFLSDEWSACLRSTRGWEITADTENGTIDRRIEAYAASAASPPAETRPPEVKEEKHEAKPKKLLPHAPLSTAPMKQKPLAERTGRRFYRDPNEMEATPAYDYRPMLYDPADRNVVEN